MAVIIEASYSKKLGLPQYSSHQYAVTVRVELVDLSQLEATNAELYAKLQDAVDAQIQQPGFTPTGASPGNGANQSEAEWNCTDKQKALILRLIDEHGLEKTEVEQLAQTRFSTSVKDLNRLQASGLIDELLETHGGNGNGTRRRSLPPRRVRR